MHTVQEKAEGVNGRCYRQKKRGRRYRDGKYRFTAFFARARRLCRPFRGADGRVNARRVIPALICLAVMAFGCARLIAYLADSRATRRANAELQALYQASAEAARAEATAAPAESPSEATAPAQTPRPTLQSAYQFIGASVLPEMEKLVKKNGDTVGWLQIPGVVDLPVVYRDNEYYLTHDFNRKRNNSGALFLDAAHPLTASTQHLVIHGHNMLNGSMFGLLSHYRRSEYIAEHGIVYFSTLYRRETYAVFAVLIVPQDISSTNYVAYSGTPAFRTEAQFDAFINALRANSLHRVTVDVNPSDALLTLSTCLKDDHIVIVCRRLREDETEQSLRAADGRA